MLFTPLAQVLVSRVQEQHYAGVRLDGPITAGKPRRRPIFGRGFFGGRLLPAGSGRRLAAA